MICDLSFCVGGFLWRGWEILEDKRIWGWMLKVRVVELEVFVGFLMEVSRW